MTNFQVIGYEDMELSTQLVIKEALLRGLKIEILDRKEQFISLSKKDHTEYIREATKTSLDSYITSLILENKWVSKILMNKAGIKTPKAHLLTKFDETQAIYNNLEECGWVVKPKSTNFGIAVHVFKFKPKKDEFISAVKNSLKYGDVLIEKYMDGHEYRFLVMGDKCIAVLNRVPANVHGDGKLSIKELVDKKNKHPWRGKAYKTPLEKINLGREEAVVLSENKLNFESVPNDGVQIMLRKNSNISTGGDSIDVTDDIHIYYKGEAIRAAKSIGAILCGVDIIIPEINYPGEYSLIEVNFNPVLYFHDYPYLGKNRNVAKYLLDLLNF